MLTQLSTLKSRLGIEPFETTDDTLLTNILKSVSARFSAECNRTFDHGLGIPYVFRAGGINIPVDRPPIESVSQFELKTSESEGWIVQSGIDFLISPARNLILLYLPFGCHEQLGRVTYTGGYVLPGNTPADDQVA